MYIILLPVLSITYKKKFYNSILKIGSGVLCSCVNELLLVSSLDRLLLEHVRITRAASKGLDYLPDFHLFRAMIAPNTNSRREILLQ